MRKQLLCGLANTDPLKIAKYTSAEDIWFIKAVWIGLYQPLNNGNYRMKEA